MLNTLPYIKHLDSGNFFLIAGPCVVESKENCIEIASHLAKITDRLKIPYIFKASYKKANRSKAESFMGIGDEKALEIIAQVKEQLKVPVITDIHTVEDANLTAKYVDILQIPAFLCRQTDLLVAAGKTGKIVNIKKGQFLAPESMKFAADKVFQTGNKKVMLTERGTTFGYYDLVVDFRGIIEMKKTGLPVILDITHSLQQPNQSSGLSGGLPELIETIARAGIAVGTDGIFMETHPDPSKALSDGANMIALSKTEKLLEKLVKIKDTLNNFG